MINGPLKVIFPLNKLKPDISLLDPENTETIWEYYLLENLSCGLIRDSKKSPLGYEGCLAKSFYQENPNTWVFILRDLKWSDGSEITSSEIEDWITNLRILPHRHIRYLPLVQDIKYDLMERKLSLVFKSQMDSSILHELSLADSGFFPKNYKINGWAKTTGPYFVEKWDNINGTLKLSSNKYSPLFNSEIPDKVNLRELTDVEKKETKLNKLNIDILTTTAFTDPQLLEKYNNTFGNVFNAYPSSILFLYFNYNSTLTQNIYIRRKIAKVIHKFRENVMKIFSKELNFKPENQMIPEGFNGRLDERINTIDKLELNPKIENIKIRIPTQLRIFPELVNELTILFHEEGIKFEPIFSDDPNFSSDEMARIYLFVGNQLDSSGSWSFLLGPPHGTISPWLPEIKNEYNSVFNAVNWTDRLIASKVLHKKVLSNFYAIPILIGYHRYFLSNRVNPSKWNEFDSRLRFYELSYK